MENQNSQTEGDYDEEAEEDEVYIQYDIATYPSDYTLSTLVKKWQDGDIKIPDFQRNYVWTIKQASLLIESFLLGLPVPPVFLYKEENTNISLVIDGQQRIRSIVDFFEGYWGEENLKGSKRVFRLTGLSPESPYGKKTFDEMSEPDRRKLEDSVLRALNTQQLKPRETDTSIYHIFERLNTGGTALRPKEIRNCVFRGSFVSELSRLNEVGAWRKLIGKPQADKFQSDKEFILRLFALSGLNEHAYESPLKEFLNFTMKQQVSASSLEWKNFSTNFEEICKLLLRELGTKPFSPRGKLSRSMMDAVFCVAIDANGNIPINFAERFERLKVNEEFLEIIQQATLSKKSVETRLRWAREALIG